MIKHVEQCFPEEIQIVFRESGLIGQWGGDETVGFVEPVRDREFTAHGSVIALLILCFLFRSHSHSGDGVFAGEDTVFAASEGQLNRATDLPAVEFLQGHHSTEGADVVEILTHPGFSLLIGGFPFFFLVGKSLVGFFLLIGKDRFFFNIDFKGRLFASGQADIVSYFTFQADVGDEAVSGFGVNARQVSGIGIAVWIAILYIEQQDEFIAVGDGGSHYSSPSSFLVSFFVKKS